jgi:hypothetical protein
MSGDIPDPPWMGDDGLDYRTAYCDVCDEQHDEDDECDEDGLDDGEET